MGYKLVEITWIDAWGDDAHFEIDALTNLVPVERYNAGFLIMEDENKVIITPGLVNNLFQGKLLVDGFMVIPWGMIKQIRILDGND